jgi:hypothetical protein
MQNSLTQKPTDNLLDITARVWVMKRDEAVLWPFKAKSPKQPAFSGLVRLSGGTGLYFRVGLWPKGKDGFGVKFTPWDRVSRKPLPGGNAIFSLLRRSGQDGHYRGETPRARITFSPRIAKNRQVYELRLEAKTQGNLNPR